MPLLTRDSMLATLMFCAVWLLRVAPVFAAILPSAKSEAMRESC